MTIPLLIPKYSTYWRNMIIASFLWSISTNTLLSILSTIVYDIEVWQWNYFTSLMLLPHLYGLAIYGVLSLQFGSPPVLVDARTKKTESGLAFLYCTGVLVIDYLMYKNMYQYLILFNGVLPYIMMRTGAYASLSR
ncbi:hypothetical protein Pan265_08550 [Mucisphaera calidilacus]|uniref:Uncharacterized protein n=1 Tax=Mucisphaera calidilacus TaxID=2527982 RepID=A0A518BVK0_9BACT|nr:hypothetical protein Pan265_08550 [Mucisphaera calidilacus]